ncbi:hypothetical protein, partial [Holdemanella biformis]
DILYLIHKKTQKNEVKFSEFGITKFNLVVFTISQWDLVLQLSKTKKFFQKRQKKLEANF